MNLSKVPLEIPGAEAPFLRSRLCFLWCSLEREMDTDVRGPHPAQKHSKPGEFLEGLTIFPSEHT